MSNIQARVAKGGVFYACHSVRGYICAIERIIARKKMLYVCRVLL